MVEVVESSGAAASVASERVVVVSIVTETDEAAEPRRRETMSDMARNGRRDLTGKDDGESRRKLEAS